MAVKPLRVGRQVTGRVECRKLHPNNSICLLLFSSFFRVFVLAVAHLFAAAGVFKVFSCDLLVVLVVLVARVYIVYILYYPFTLCSLHFIGGAT